MKRWKLGISSADSAPESAPLLLLGDITENLEKASRLGFDAIEVHTREDAALDYEKIQKKINETGVRIAQIITGRLYTEGACSMMDDRPYVVKAVMEGMKQYVDMAARLGADIVIGWAKGSVPLGKEPTNYIRRLADNLQVLNEYAKAKKVKINLEVINHYETNVLVTAAEAVEFIEQYGLDNCYIHLDTYHMNLEETDPCQAIRASANHLGYFHIADNTRWYPGSGTLDFKEIFKTLEEVGYEGYVTVECFRRGSGEETGKKAMTFLNKMLH